MSTFTFTPNYGVDLNKHPKNRIAKFGDGYQQRAADGINTLAREWSLFFDDLKVNIEEIDTFLETESGLTSFDWTPPSGIAGKWICQEWKVTAVSFGKWTLQAVFEEVFGE